MKPAQRIVIGLTGSFGSGKTTVAGIFKALGAKVIDADGIAHQLFCPDNKIYRKLLSVFGRGIIKRNSLIDRARLGRIVFSDKKLLGKLNRVTHPEIIRIIRNKIKASSQGVIVLDAPLLLETGLAKFVDRVIVVDITHKLQLGRIHKRNKLSDREMEKRIKSQIPLRKKLEAADFIIDNSGTIRETKKQVKQIWENINFPG